MLRYLLVLAIVVLLCNSSHAQTSASEQAKLLDFFETKIRPVLAERCFSCHAGEKSKGGIRLDRRNSVFKSSEEPLIVPGHPEKSLLVKVIRHEGDSKMPPPPKAKLSDHAINDITTWIKLGAAWPEDASKTAVVDPRRHWAFQPVRRPPVPASPMKDWADNPIDAFVLEKLREKKLTPNPPADPRVLIRRICFDLVGLPPTFDEVEAFAKACSNGNPQSAIANLVDRLLASPQYGERWARHWLDVARYADTKGYVFQEERRYAYSYTYRDYVIKAFNDDLPYDQFLLHQLAADRLVARKEAPPSTQAAMGFLTLGRRFLNNIHDITDDRIDVVSRGLLGLTVACARCHDHKYEPITMKEYYGLYGVFSSSVEPKDLPLLGEPEQSKEYAVFQMQLEKLEKAVKEYQVKFKKELDEKNRKHRDELRALEKKVDSFKAGSPIAPPRGMVMVDRPNPGDARVFLRGNPNNPGPIVPRQFLTILSKEPPRPFKDGSGRLELARAIADKNNPLTARVMVNRIWMHHFGSGLVASPSNFGLRADPPTHPELLDFLAATFMEDGWSIKKLHKRILMSKTYQLSSAEQPNARTVDPDNRWLARANRRRLDFEAMRDSLLLAARNLDLTMGGKGVDLTTAPFSRRRAIYGFIDRQNLPGVFRTFDLASPDTSTAQRFQTTVPQQALFLLNHPFIQDQARRVAMNTSEVKDPAERVRRLYRDVYSRWPDADEVRIGVQFVEKSASLPRAEGGMSPWECFAQALLVANEFMFID